MLLPATAKIIIIKNISECTLNYSSLACKRRHPTQDTIFKHSSYKPCLFSWYTKQSHETMGLWLSSLYSGLVIASTWVWLWLLAMHKMPILFCRCTEWIKVVWTSGSWLISSSYLSAVQFTEQPLSLLAFLHIHSTHNWTHMLWPALGRFISSIKLKSTSWPVVLNSRFTTRNWKTEEEKKTRKEKKEKKKKKRRRLLPCWTDCKSSQA